MADHDFDKDITDIANSDAKALSNIYAAYKTAVYSLAVSILHDHQAAEDVSQDVFLKIWINARSFRIGSNPKSWILSITRNEAIDAWRKKMPLVSMDDEFVNGIADDRDDYESKLNTMVLTGKLKELPEDIAQIIVLHVVGGLNNMEIGRIMKMSIATVYRKYNKGISILQERLAEEEGVEQNV